MATTERKSFELRPHDALGKWQSNDRRYKAYAHELLAELEALCAEVFSKWPIEAGASIHDPQNHPELWKLTRLRDRTSDSVCIYAAMAVEGFLNFYGVMRLGQPVFDEHFERSGLVPKLRSLLLVCDALEIKRNDPIVLLLDNVAQTRNSLVHPKAKEVVGIVETHEGVGTKIPDAARETVSNMEAFFEQFAQAVPLARRYADAT